MKTLFAILLVAAFSTITLCKAQAADASACYSIGDADARLYCLAKARNEPSTCYSIVKPDLRSMCLAETRR